MAYILLVILLVSACTSHTDDSSSIVQEQSAVAVGAASEQSRLSGSLDGGLLEFTLFAQQHRGEFEAQVWEANFMNNQCVARLSLDGEWSYTPVKYWPSSEEDMVSFFAYAPYDCGSNIIDFRVVDGVITVDYTSAPSSGDQVDLMVAPALLNRSAGVVCFQGEARFRHALAAIRFTINSSVRYRVLSIEVEELIGSGTLTMSSSAQMEWELLHTSRDNFTILVDSVDSQDNIYYSDYLMLIPQRSILPRSVNITLEDNLRSSQDIMEFYLPWWSEWSAGEIYNYSIDISPEPSLEQQVELDFNNLPSSASQVDGDIWVITGSGKVDDDNWEDLQKLLASVEDGREIELTLQGVEEIPDNAISSGRSDCVSLVSLTVTDATYIGQEAFYNCTNLYSISLDCVEKFEKNCFAGCSSLTDIYIPRATEIIESAFRGCSALRRATIAILSSEIKIDQSAFTGCDLSLVSLTTSENNGSSVNGNIWRVEGVNFEFLSIDTI